MITGKAADAPAAGTTTWNGRLALTVAACTVQVCAMLNVPLLRGLAEIVGGGVEELVGGGGDGDGGGGGGDSGGVVC